MTSTILVSIIIAYNLTLIRYLIRRGRKVPSTIFFGLLILSATIWAFTILITDLLRNFDQIALWSRLSFTSSAMVVLMLYFFATYFPEYSRSLHGGGYRIRLGTTGISRIYDARFWLFSRSSHKEV